MFKKSEVKHLLKQVSDRITKAKGFTLSLEVLGKARYSLVVLGEGKKFTLVKSETLKGLYSDLFHFLQSPEYIQKRFEYAVSVIKEHGKRKENQS
jgi:hypothetical protein